MTDEEYLTTQNQLVTLARICQMIDLRGFLARISKAETVGPLLDPTLYRKAGDQLQRLKTLAQSLLPFQEEVKRQILIGQSKIVNDDGLMALGKGSRDMVVRHG